MSRRTGLALVVLVTGLALAAQALAASPNGSAGDMPAYYDGQLFTINFKQQPSGGEASLLTHNGSINTIYMSDQAEAAGVMFTSVLDAIQGDGFNPLWQAVQIVFKTIRPQQFVSDNDILAAAAAGQIALVPTTEVYRCAVVGTK
jgi:hypothetical protein